MSEHLHSVETVRTHEPHTHTHTHKSADCLQTHTATRRGRTSYRASMLLLPGAFGTSVSICSVKVDTSERLWKANTKHHCHVRVRERVYVHISNNMHVPRRVLRQEANALHQSHEWSYRKSATPSESCPCAFIEDWHANSKSEGTVCLSLFHLSHVFRGGGLWVPGVDVHCINRS